MINKYIAAIISFFLPGIGEIIQGGPLARNLILLLVDLIVGFLTYRFSPYLGIISLIISIYAVYETLQMSE